MKFISLFIFLFSTSFGYSQTNTAVRIALNKIINDPELKNASISFYALDLDSNKIITSFEKDRSLVPASTMKLVTTAAALEILGAQKKLTTAVRYSGYIDSNKVLNGNVYIVGGGDPALGAKRYQKHYGNFINQWAKSLMLLGVDSINGRVVANSSIFKNQTTPATWIWGDMGNYYGASPSGLSIYENRCYIDLKSGKTGDSTIIKCITPYIPNLSFQNKVKGMNIKKDNAYVFGAPYQDNRIIIGGIPSHKKQFTIKASIPDPAFLAAFELDMELRNLGVKIANPSSTLNVLDLPVVKNTTMVTQTKSPSLHSLVKQTNTYSLNLYAEHFLNLIGISKYKSGETDSGRLAVLEFWKSKGMDVSGFYVFDGSGLSRFNGITSKQMVFILKYMKESKNGNYFKRSLSIAGKTGTLRNVGKSTAAQGNVYAKSGYMTRVRSYAGYVKTKNNKTLAFALIVNNYNCTAYQMKKKMEQVIIKLAEIEK